MVELHFVVDRDGRVDRVTSPTTDVPDTILRSAMTSIKRSRFAPRIDNGLAVPTEDMVFYEKVLVRVAQPPDAQPSSGKAEEPSPEQKAEPAAVPSPQESEKTVPEPEEGVASGELFATTGVSLIGNASMAITAAAATASGCRVPAPASAPTPATPSTAWRHPAPGTA